MTPSKSLAAATTSAAPSNPVVSLSNHGKAPAARPSTSSGLRWSISAAAALAVLALSAAGRAGAAEDALRRRLRRLVRADHAQGDLPGVRGQARRQGRVRRRQFHGHAGQAAGAEGQPADRRRHRRRRADVPGDPAGLLRQDRGPAGRRSLRRRALQGRQGRRHRPRRHRPDVQHQVLRGEGLAGAHVLERSQGPQDQEAAGDPADQQHLRSLYADDVRAHERRRREERRAGLQGDEGRGQRQRAGLRAVARQDDGAVPVGPGGAGRVGLGARAVVRQHRITRSTSSTRRKAR